jgi:lipopolysaccharide biosynthesis protein
MSARPRRSSPGTCSPACRPSWASTTCGQPEVLRDQAQLAKMAGVDAFCFHYYWFGGHRLLERPLDAFVADDSIDLPFALCWANENWTRRWDGQESDILIAQNHSPEDDVALFDDLARYIRSPRYVRVDGKPLIVVYRPDILPDAPATAARWRERARQAGLGELFLLCTNAFGFSDYKAAGFDGSGRVSAPRPGGGRDHRPDPAPQSWLRRTGL